MQRWFRDTHQDTVKIKSEAGYKWQCCGVKLSDSLLSKFKCVSIFFLKKLLCKTRAGFNILFYCLESVEPSDVLVSSLARLEYSEYSRYWTWMSGHPPLGLHFSVCQEFGSGKENEFKFLSVFIWNTQPTPWALRKPINSLCFSSLLLVPCYNTVMRLRCCMRSGGEAFH